MLRVRSRVVGGWLLAAGLLATTVVGACADKKGALMLAITTDMKAPKDVNAVAVSITTNGLVKASFIGRVTPQGDILLPGTLAIVEPDDKNAVIRIRVMAFQNQKPRVIRDVRTTAPPDGRTALLRIPLNFVNDGKVAGSPLPDGLVPDPVPGTEGLSPPASATTGDAGSVGTKDLSPSGGDFDFMLNFQPKDCLNPQDETIINGECKDSYIDSATLPDFDAEQLGDSTGQTGTCFDLTKCFAGAIDTGQRSDAGTQDGGDVEPGDAARADSSTPVDAGPKPFKDFRPATLDFDAVGCTYKLNGADPTRLNIAIVTPDTGECVRAGECYVPIDRSATTGWRDDGSGTVYLPDYLCRFLTAKGLHLATSTDVCEAKLESNPICTPKAGDDAGISPAADATPPPDSSKPDLMFAIPEDFASAVAIFGPTLYFASASRQGFANLLDPAMPPQALKGVGVGGGQHLPWRFGAGKDGVALVNGTSTGYLLGPDPNATATPVAFTFPIIDVAGTGTALIWAATQVSGPSFFITSSTAPTPIQAEVQIPGVTAVGSTSFPNLIVVGDSSGGVRVCQPELMSCGTVSALNGARVDALALKDKNTGYALTGNGIYFAVADPQTQVTTTQRVVSDASSFVGIQDGTSYLAHGAAVSGPCLVYSSVKGLEYLVETGGTVSVTKVLVPATSGPILGVAIGPDMTTGGNAAYYAVYAPGGGIGATTGGGIFRVSLPPECSGGAGLDGGAGSDGGAACSPANCLTGCCSPALGCQPGTAANACGKAGGGACSDCTVGGMTCDQAMRTCL